MRVFFEIACHEFEIQWNSSYVGPIIILQNFHYWTLKLIENPFLV